MANDENLEKFKFKKGEPSSEEAASRGRKGGIASGAVRRKKRDTVKMLQEMVNCKPQITARRRRMLEAQGWDPDAPNLTLDDIIQAAFLTKVANGDLQAYRYYCEMFGHDPKTKLEEMRLKVQQDAVQAIRNADGFMEAMRDTVEEVFEDGSDTPDTLEDSE